MTIMSPMSSDQLGSTISQQIKYVISQNQIPLDVVGSSTFDRYKKQSVGRTYNFSISNGSMVVAPGYKKVLEIVPGNVESREVYRSIKFNHLVVVIQNVVFLVDDNLGLSEAGLLETSSGEVFITENNANQIAISDGLFIYILNTEVLTFTKVTVDFQPGYITFQDTYFIAADKLTNNFRFSDNNDGLIWRPASDAQVVGEIETKPDLMVAPVAFDRQLFVMGQKSTEIWHDVGAQLFPYQRDNSLSIDYGCLSASTIATGFGLLVWLAVNEKAGPTIMVSSGGPPSQLSTDGINFELDKLKAPEDSTAFLYEEDGHVFYQINFRSDNETLVYDFNTQKFFNASDHCLNVHIARRIGFFNNTHFFIATNEGALYELSTDFVTYKDTLDPNDDGHEIPRVRLTQPLRLPDASRFVMTKLSLTLEQGQSNEIQKVGLSISRDGGQTFGTVVHKELKGLGGRPNRLDWYGLGSANDAVFQFRFWGKTRFVINGATVEVRQ